MSRRDQIKMSVAEVQAFLKEQRTMSIGTIGRDGRPHVVAMWYAFLDGVPSFWTFAKSQKVVNLRRGGRRGGAAVWCLGVRAVSEHQGH